MGVTSHNLSFFVCKMGIIIISIAEDAEASHECAHKAFSIKGPGVNIWGFAGHTQSLSFLLLLFLQPFTDEKPILSSQVVQKQAMGQIWPMGHSADPTLHFRVQLMFLTMILTSLHFAGQSIGAGSPGGFVQDPTAH